MKPRKLSECVFGARLPIKLAENIKAEAESLSVSVSSIVRRRIISGSTPAFTGEILVLKDGLEIPIGALDGAQIRKK